MRLTRPCSRTDPSRHRWTRKCSASRSGEGFRVVFRTTPSRPVENRGSYQKPLYKRTPTYICQVEYWFTTGLTKVQKGFVEYAKGPTNVLENTFISKPFDEPSHQLCNSQKIKAPPGSGAISFSTLGVALILAIGGLLILCHTILEYVTANVVATRNHKLIRWGIDDKLQLQRLAFEGAGMGTWKASMGSVPTTNSHELFGMEIGEDRQHPTFYSKASDEEKQLGTVRVDSVGTQMTRISTKRSDKDWSTRSTVRNDSYQLPPIHIEDDREIWPLVDTAGGSTQHQTHHTYR